VAERDWGFEVGVTTSSGPSDVTSEIAGDDHELQSRWLVGAQVWGGGVYIPLANNRQRRQIAKRSRARKKEDFPKEASWRRQGPGGQGGTRGEERERGRRRARNGIPRERRGGAAAQTRGQGKSGVCR